MIVDTYQSVSGTGAESDRAELEGQVRAHVAGDAPVASRSIRTRSHSTRCPRSTPSFDERLHQRGVEGRQRDRARSCTCPTFRSRVRRSASRSSSDTQRPSTWRRERPIDARERTDAFAAMPGVVVVDDPASHSYPLASEAAGRDEIFVGSRATRHLGPERTAASRSGSSRTTCARARPRTPSSSQRSSWDGAGSSTHRPAGLGRTAPWSQSWSPAGARCDRRRAPGGARGDRG